MSLPLVSTTLRLWSPEAPYEPEKVTSLPASVLLNSSAAALLAASGTAKPTMLTVSPPSPLPPSVLAQAEWLGGQSRQRRDHSAQFQAGQRELLPEYF